MRDYKLYLHDIKEAAEKIEVFIKGFTFEEFVKDAKTVDAVIRNLEIMGEAAKHIPKRVKERHADIDWKAMAGMRNILTHEYFGVRMEGIPGRRDSGFRGHIFICHEIYFKVSSIKKLAPPNADFGLWIAELKTKNSLAQSAWGRAHPPMRFDLLRRTGSAEESRDLLG